METRGSPVRMAAVAMGFVIALAAGLMHAAGSVAHAARPAIVEYIGPIALDFPFLDCGDGSAAGSAIRGQ